ncbi:DUF4867 family protein [Bacillus kexueae]|uniref:DUF4867 family protein n=1 Tax=Aeribacillus kexueae TaxID=2078952 RepID=UPI001FAF91D2|nr:DUF4867 family protein [Bacillus kexueae]
MTYLERIRICNQSIPIYTIHNNLFNQYGKIMKIDADFMELFQCLEETKIPNDGNIYVASDQKMEQTKVKEKVKRDYYGDLSIQIGYCNGHNEYLNALEFHNGHELFLAGTDLVLLLGTREEMVGDFFYTKNVKAFFVPKHSCLEIYSTTLHFSPCQVTTEGFKSIIILPEGTNTPLQHREQNDLLFMKNKWLLTHSDCERLVEKGAFQGLLGENIHICPIT